MLQISVTLRSAKGVSIVVPEKISKVQNRVHTKIGVSLINAATT